MSALKQFVEIYEAKPNKMFPPELTALVRFLRYHKPIPCAECGSVRKNHWTMLCSFQALDMAVVVPKRSGKVHQPLTPVCRKHLQKPEVETP